MQLRTQELGNEMIWDDYMAQFERVVGLVQEIFDAGKPKGRDSERGGEGSGNGVERPSFSLDLGLIGPLYLVVARCRDPFIRRYVEPRPQSTKCPGWEYSLIHEKIQREGKIEKLAGFKL